MLQVLAQCGDADVPWSDTAPNHVFGRAARPAPKSAAQRLCILAMAILSLTDVFCRSVDHRRWVGAARSNAQHHETVLSMGWTRIMENKTVHS
jgi:hypothetical protein